MCRQLNKRGQRILFQKNYDELIETVEEFIKNYSLYSVAQKAVIMVKTIIPYCDGELLNDMILGCEHLQMKTCDYNDISILILPLIKFHIKLHKQITCSLLNGSPDIELIYHYFMSGKYDEDGKLVINNRLIKLQDVAPNYIQQKASKQ